MQYLFLCETMGSIPLLAEATNCSAPDTGNMETILRYGNEDQIERFGLPLLNGKVRSVFAMTEPAVASSDATNIATSIKADGDDYIVNGRKWWSSGAMQSNCKTAILMGKTDPTAAKHKQQSMILIDFDTPGIDVMRHLSVFGYDHAPHGHAEVNYDNVRVPKSNLLLGEGRGFEIAQGRLGPGRIHHCMRSIGSAEKALALMCNRVKERTAFGTTLAEKGTILHDIAESRIEIEMLRNLTMQATMVMDAVGNKEARNIIAMTKVYAPNMLCRVIDRALQAHGGAGVSQDTPLASMYASARTLRFADGPDEVHRAKIAQAELKKY